MKSGPKPRSLKERFWEKIDVHKSNECWEWNAAKISKGYGVIGDESGKMQYATHVLFYLRKGYWPPKGRTCNHICDNPGCVNPKHLYLGTQKSNVRDRDQRNRSNYVKGERNGKAKLTERKVYEIKRLLKQGIMTQRELGRKFGVDPTHISCINTGKVWRHIDDH